MSVDNQNINYVDHLEFKSLSDVGAQRKENQDRYGYFLGENYKVYIVADGMGGAKGGARAAQIAVDTLKQELALIDHLEPVDLERIIKKANKNIFQESLEDPALEGMGTTIVLVAITATKIYIASVGDSRAYKIRDGKQIQLNKDHTLVNELLEAGLIDPSQAESHPVAHMLTRSLGPAVQVDVDCLLDNSELIKDDIYLLCSDGLYNMLEEGEIAKVIDVNDLETSVQALIDLANERGGSDNITVVLVKFTGSVEASSDIDFNQSSLNLPILSERQHPPVDRTFINRFNPQDFEQGKLTERSRSRVPYLLILLLMTCYLSWDLLNSDFGVFQIIQQQKVNTLQEPTVKSEEFKESLKVEPKVKAEILSDQEKMDLDIDVKQVYAEYLERLSGDNFLSFLNSRYEEKNAEFFELNQQYRLGLKAIDSLSKEHQNWKKRQIKLESKDALSLAHEVGGYSPVVKEKLKVFQETSWSYLDRLGDIPSKQNGGSDNELLKARKDALNDLELTVDSVVQEKVITLSKQVSEIKEENKVKYLDIQKANSELNLINYILANWDLGEDYIKSHLEGLIS